MSDTRPYGPQGLWILATLVAAVAFASAPVLVRWLIEVEMQPVEIAFARFALTAIVMLPFLGVRGGQFGSTAMGLVAGVALGYGWVGYAIVLERLTIATAGVLYMSFPVFTIIFMIALLNRLPGVRATLAAMLSAAAIWLVLPLEKIELVTWPVALVALAAPASLGFAVAVRNGWLLQLSPLQGLACVPLGACLGLAPALALQRQALTLPTGEQWPLLIALAAGAVLLPSFFYLVAQPRLGALRATSIAAMEIPALFILGQLFFAEQASERELAGGMAAVIAMLLVAVSDRPLGRPPTA